MGKHTCLSVLYMNQRYSSSLNRAFLVPTLMHFRMDRKSETLTRLMYFNGVYTTQLKNGFPIWERQKQENKGGYTFSGRTMMAHGFMGELSAFEVFSIMLDLYAFILQKGKIDYFQVFNRKSDGQKVFYIDQLSEIMKSDRSYSEENLKEYDYHTYLLAREY
jgi:hypothetical protein